MAKPKQLASSTIEKLKQASITVRTFNGTYEHAEAKVALARGNVELSCDVTHPLMVPFDRQRDEVCLIVCEGSRGYHIEVPAALQEKVNSLRQAATLDDRVAAQRATDMAKALRETYVALGIVGA